MNAFRFAADLTKSKCRELDASKFRAWGHLFGPDQNGTPEEVA